MSEAIWSLEYGGERRPLAQWGIEQPILELGNQIVDTLKFRTAGEDGTSPPRFAYDVAVSLWRDAVCWFSGVVTQTPWANTAQADRQVYEVSGAWIYLEEIVYEQPRYVAVDPQVRTLGYTQTDSGQLVLFQSALGAKLTTGAQALDVVNYARTRGAQILGVSYVDLTTDAPFEKAVDISCAEALKRCCRWTRDAVAWFSYAAVPPVLNLRRRANLTAVTLDLAAADKIAATELTPRPDLVPSGVILRFAQVQTNAETGAQWTTYTVQPAGNAFGGRRCIKATLELAGTGESAEPVPVNLATDYYNSLATLQWQGTITLKEREGVSGILTMGMRLNLTGGRAAWETMNAVIQRVIYDIDARQTVAEFGPAEQLGASDFLDQLRTQKDGSAGEDVSGRMDGTPPKTVPATKPPPAPPAPGTSLGGDNGGSMRGVFVDVCDPATKTKRTVFVS